MVATGRGYQEIERVMQHVKIPVKYAIAQNGTYIYKDGQEIFGAQLTAENAKEIIAQIKATGIPVDYIMLSTDKGIAYFRSFTIKGWFMKRYFRHQHGGRKLRERTWTDLEQQQLRICKVLVYTSSKKAGALEEKLLAAIEQKYAVFASSPASIEICAAGVSKGAAIEFLAELESWDKAEIGFVGDSGNDLSAIEVVGQSYVMKNALPQYKSGAKKQVVDVAEALSDFMYMEGKKDEQ